MTTQQASVSMQLDPNNCYKVLITDLIGMQLNSAGEADCSEVEQHIVKRGGLFHRGAYHADQQLAAQQVHFFYQPQLSREPELLAQTDQGQYDACIAAATFIPSAAKFRFGGVRIGAGTGNMGSDSWGGGSAIGGIAPLMNTPSYNSRATAQAAFKALLTVMPDLAVQDMHQRVVAGDFDTGKNLAQYPCSKLEGKRLAIIGYGNIGREMAKLGAAFGMQVAIYARAKHQVWIESEGFEYAASIIDAATGADVISPHIGLGAFDKLRMQFSNAGIINAAVFAAMHKSGVLINYDRGEVVDIQALDQALSSGQISYAAIDADIFKDPLSGELSGPMVNYRNIYPKHVGKMELLPHAAADTEHISRVEGAKQAVDQIFAVIQDRQVINLVGDLPTGFIDAGAKTVPGVGKITTHNFTELTPNQIKRLQQSSQTIAHFWQQMHQTNEPQSAEQVEKLLLASNQYCSMMQRLGLLGPFEK
ncbi:MAG: hypothetical protein HRU05_07780 [Oceanospirillaceae bacterium]|nr:hypothetical protein [Oceanospirillaceae bacterium]